MSRIAWRINRVCFVNKPLSAAFLFLELLRYIAREIRYDYQGRRGYHFRTYLANQLADGNYDPARSRIVANFILFSALRARDKKVVSWTLTYFAGVLDVAKLSTQDRKFISLVTSKNLDDINAG